FYPALFLTLPDLVPAPILLLKHPDLVVHPVPDSADLRLLCPDLHQLRPVRLCTRSTLSDTTPSNEGEGTGVTNDSGPTGARYINPALRILGILHNMKSHICSQTIVRGAPHADHSERDSCVEGDQRVGERERENKSESTDSFAYVPLCTLSGNAQYS
ncbi:hypothetical protein XELAEV_18017098mg, partial [Xenopus laevis]